MANRTATVAAMAVAAMLAGAHVAGAESSPAALNLAAERAHVRSGSPAIKAAIDEAMRRSVTFRALIAAINESESYVFVNEGECGHGVRACFLNVRSSGSFRFLFVHIDQSRRDLDLMASLGHELRHAIEVIDEPSVRSDSEKFFFYERIGMRGAGGTRETTAAMDTGNEVRSEISSFNRQAKPQ